MKAKDNESRRFAIDRDLADAMVTMWHCNGTMGNAIRLYLLAKGEEASNEHIFSIANNLAKNAHVYRWRVSRFLSSRMSLVRDALFDGLDDERVAEMIVNIAPDSRGRIVFGDDGARKEVDRWRATVFVEERKLDRRFDWKTVK